MVDVEDVGEGFAYGGIFFGVVLLVVYLVFSKPEIEACHDKGGVIARIEGKDICVDKSVFKPIEISK
jgi:hypothetical protein